MTLIESDRFLNVTDIAHSAYLLEQFVQEKLQVLENISVPVTLGGKLHNPANDPPTRVPADVVAVMIRQKNIPATITVNLVNTGYVVTESTSSKPEEYYLLFVNCGAHRRCSIEGTVEVRYFMPRDPVARAVFFAKYYA